MASNNSSPYKFKILFLGDTNVGKTVFFNKIFDEKNSKNPLATIGVSYRAKNIKYDGKLAQLEIWDTAGQEKYKAITINFFKGANGIFLFYDITRTETYYNIRNWLKQIKEELKLDSISIIVLGNKIDLKEERKVDYKEGKKLADDINSKFLETSGLTGDNVDKAVLLMVEDLINKGHTKVEKSFCIGDKDSVLPPNENEKVKKCC